MPESPQWIPLSLVDAKNEFLKSANVTLGEWFQGKNFSPYVEKPTLAASSLKVEWNTVQIDGIRNICDALEKSLLNTMSPSQLEQMKTELHETIEGLEFQKLTLEDERDNRIPIEYAKHDQIRKAQKWQWVTAAMIEDAIREIRFIEQRKRDIPGELSMLIHQIRDTGECLWSLNFIKPLSEEGMRHIREELRILLETQSQTFEEPKKAAKPVKTLPVTTADITVIEPPVVIHHTRTPGIRWVTYPLAAAVLAVLTSVAIQHRGEKQKQTTEWRMSRIGEYFSSLEIATMTEEEVQKYSSLGAQLKDANRNHQWNLSDGEIRKLVWLRDPLKISMAEPRFVWDNPELSRQIQERWTAFFDQNQEEVIRLCSEEKFLELLSFMREKDDVFAHITSHAWANIVTGLDGVTLHIWWSGHLALNFILGPEFIPDQFKHIATAIKSDIEGWKIGIKDIGIFEKNGWFIEHLSTIMGIDRSKFSVMSFPLHQWEFLQVTLYNIDEKSPTKGERKNFFINIGEPLRQYAHKNDPSGVEIMKKTLWANNFPTYAQIMIAESVDQVVWERSDEIVPKLRKIQEEFQNAHHEFPEAFLKLLEWYIATEIKKGSLGILFWGENISVLCNAISQNGVEVHVYICRGDRVFFAGNTIITPEWARNSWMCVQERHALGKVLQKAFIENPQGDFSQIQKKTEDGNIQIQPGSVSLLPIPSGPSGADFWAILQYMSIISSGNQTWQMQEYTYIPDFWSKISSLSLPRGLEGKVFFHPVEIESIAEAFIKIPGLAGIPITLNFILYEGKKRAVATVKFGEQKIDILLPEAEKRTINTTMTPEDQGAIQKCISESSENFAKHGAILGLWNDIVNKVSRVFRAKLADLTVKPESINGTYGVWIKIKLTDGTYYETSISAAE